MSPTSSVWTRVPACLGLLSAVAVVGCGEKSPPPPDPAPDSEEHSSSSEQMIGGEVYERDFVFLTQRADSLLAVPWSFRAQPHSEGVRRTTQGWLLRGAAWEEFVNEVVETPPTRAPWRILPGPNTRILMGPGEGLEALVFSDGARQLRLDMGERITEWAGPRGESLRIHRAEASILSETRSGLLLDLTRGGTAGEPDFDDRVFLVSGDSLQLYLDVPRGQEGSPDAARAWTRLDLLDSHWPDVTLEWPEVRPFERARRDVPVRWSFHARGGGLAGELVAEASHLEALEGDGAISPVEGFFQVRGEVRFGERTLPVLGVVRHRQQ